MISCCKDCPDREPHCHGNCERYLKERAELDAMKESVRKQHIVDDYYQTAIHRARDVEMLRQIKRNRFEKGHGE